MADDKGSASTRSRLQTKPVQQHRLPSLDTSPTAFPSIRSASDHNPRGPRPYNHFSDRASSTFFNSPELKNLLETAEGVMEIDQQTDASGSGSGSQDKSKKTEKRVGRSCDACRKAKVRCPDGSPTEACSKCKAANRPCTFEEKPAKRGPPRGYVESLERRLEAMEGLLRALTAANEGDPGTEEEQRLRDEEKEKAELDRERERKRENFDPSVDALTADMDELSVDRDRYVGRGSGLHLAKSIRKFSQTAGPDNVFCPEGPSLEDEAFGSIVELMLHDEHKNQANTQKLPDQDLRDRLVNCYFEEFNCDQALLHRPSFDRAVKSGKLDTDASFRSLYFMVLAIGARWADDPRLATNIPFTLDELHPDSNPEQTKGFHLFQASSASASPPLTSATLYDIQTSVLGIFWLLGAATPIGAWAAAGYAIRRMIDVGAHRENRARWNASPLEDQLRRRAFHTLYGLDRMLSATLGRPLAIQDDDIDLCPALDITDADLDSWQARVAAANGVNLASVRPPATKTPGPLAALQCWTRLQKIVGRALKLLYGMNRKGNGTAGEAVTELDSLLNEWLTQIPEHLRWDPATQDKRWLGQSAMIYSAYYCCQILCHRDFISPSRARLHAFPSLAICSNAARSCSHVLDYAAKHGQARRGFYYFPVSSVQSGLILLINVFAKGSMVASLSSSAMSDVRKCIRVLDILGEGTFLAVKCGRGLSQLADLASTPPSSLPTANVGNSLITHKRPSPSDNVESPASMGSSSSPSASTTEGDDNFIDSSQPNPHKKSRRVENLPLTTDDLSLGTFIGHPTFNLNGANLANLGGIDAAAGLMNFQLPISFAPPVIPDTNFYVSPPPPSQPLQQSTTNLLQPSTTYTLPDFQPFAQPAQPWSNPQQSQTQPSQQQDFNFLSTATFPSTSPLGDASAFDTLAAMGFTGMTGNDTFDWTPWGVNVNEENQMNWNAFSTNAMGV